MMTIQQHRAYQQDGVRRKMINRWAVPCNSFLLKNYDYSLKPSDTSPDIFVKDTILFIFGWLYDNRNPDSPMP